MSNLSAAVSLAELGYRVFPVAVNAKIPLISQWPEKATTDLGQIEAWWTQFPNANIGMVTDGLLVVDVDAEGVSWLQTVKLEDFCDVPCSRTAGGGLHYIFQQPPGAGLRNTVSVLAPHVDTRADGGFIVVPDSHVGGKSYQWIVALDVAAGQLPVAPAWIVAGVSDRKATLSAEPPPEVFPDHTRNANLTRFAGLFRRSGATEEELLASLQAINARRCVPPLPDEELATIAASVARYEPDAVEQALIYNHFAAVPPTPETLTSIDDEQEASEKVPQEIIDGMPYYMRVAYDWIMETAIRPQPEITLGALIAMFATVYGRKVRDDYNTRTNIQVMALAPSGAGKDHPRQCVRRILDEAGCGYLNGPERLVSASGIISALNARPEHPVRLLQIDEIGRLLLTIHDTHNPIMFHISTLIMALYTAAKGSWNGDAFADARKTVVLQQPCLCLFGTSVPEHVWDGFSEANLSDGMLSRFIVFSTSNYGKRRKPAIRDIPPQLLSHIRWWQMDRSNEDFDILPASDGTSFFKPTQRGNIADLGMNHRPVIMRKTAECDERHEKYSNDIEARHEVEGSVARAIWSRAGEKAAKLALIYACANSDDSQPEITIEAERWGIAIANYSTRLMVSAARKRVTRTSLEKVKKRLWEAIPAPGKTIDMWHLQRNTQWLSGRERYQILLEWQEMGLVVVDEVKRERGRPGRQIRKTSAYLS